MKQLILHHEKDDISLDVYEDEAGIRTCFINGQEMECGEITDDILIDISQAEIEVKEEKP